MLHVIEGNEVCLRPGMFVNTQLFLWISWTVFERSPASDLQVRRTYVEQTHNQCYFHCQSGVMHLTLIEQLYLFVQWLSGFCWHLGGNVFHHKWSKHAKVD